MYAIKVFENYAQKIVNHHTLTIEEQNDIHRFGLWLIGFFSGGIKEEEPTLVADVCTNSFTGKVLHKGVGKFNPIIIIYEQPDGITMAGLGFVMSYYEFTEENFNRITDSEWKERTEKGTLPPRPFWADSFLYPAANQPPITSFSYYPENPIVNQPVTFNTSEHTRHV